DTERPEGLKGELALIFRRQLAEGGDDRWVAPLGEDPAGLTDKPVVAMGQKTDEVSAGQLARGQAFDRRRSIRFDLVDSAIRAVPIVNRVDMIDALVVPVGDVERAVRASEAIDGPKPGVVADQKIAAEPSPETRSLRLQDVPIKRVGQRVGGDVDVV